MALFTPVVAAAACPGVEIDFRGDRWTDELKANTTAELEAEGDRAGLCGGEKRASVRLVWQGSEVLGIAVDLVRDDGTELQLRRKVDASSLPADGLPLAVSAVVGDLLRESKPPDVRPPPEPVETRFGLGVRGAGMYGSSTARGIGEAFGRFSLGRFGVQLAVGGGGGEAFAGDAGSVGVRVLTVGLTGLVRLFGGDRWSLSAELGAVGGPWWLSAMPANGYTGGSAVTWAIAGRAGLDAVIGLAPLLGVLIAAGVDIPFRGVAVTDGAQRVASPVAIAGYVALGVVFTW